MSGVDDKDGMDGMDDNQNSNGKHDNANRQPILFRAWSGPPVNANEQTDPEIRRLEKQCEETRLDVQRLREHGRRLRLQRLQTLDALETRRITLTEIYRRMDKELNERDVYQYGDVLAEVFGQRTIFAHRAIGLEALLCQFMHQMLTKQHQLKVIKKAAKDLQDMYKRRRLQVRDEYHSYEALSVQVEASRLYLEAMYDDIFTSQHRLLAKWMHRVDASSSTASTETKITASITATKTVSSSLQPNKKQITKKWTPTPTPEKSSHSEMAAAAVAASTDSDDDQQLAMDILLTSPPHSYHDEDQNNNVDTTAKEKKELVSEQAVKAAKSILNHSSSDILFASPKNQSASANNNNDNSNKTMALLSARAQDRIKRFETLEAARIKHNNPPPPLESGATKQPVPTSVSSADKGSILPFESAKDITRPTDDVKGNHPSVGNSKEGAKNLEDPEEQPLLSTSEQQQQPILRPPTTSLDDDIKHILRSLPISLEEDIKHIIRSPTTSLEEDIKDIRPPQEILHVQTNGSSPIIVSSLEEEIKHNRASPITTTPTTLCSTPSLEEDMKHSRQPQKIPQIQTNGSSPIIISSLEEEIKHNGSNLITMTTTATLCSTPTSADGAGTGAGPEGRGSARGRRRQIEKKRLASGHASSSGPSNNAMFEPPDAAADGPAKVRARMRELEYQANKPPSLVPSPPETTSTTSDGNSKPSTESCNATAGKEVSPSPPKDSSPAILPKDSANEEELCAGVLACAVTDLHNKMVTDPNSSKVANSDEKENAEKVADDAPAKSQADFIHERARDLSDKASVADDDVEDDEENDEVSYEYVEEGNVTAQDFFELN
jgi:hypothetical protein